MAALNYIILKYGSCDTYIQHGKDFEPLNKINIITNLPFDILNIFCEVCAIMSQNTWRTSPKHSTTIK